MYSDRQARQAVLGFHPLHTSEYQAQEQATVQPGMLCSAWVRIVFRDRGVRGGGMVVKGVWRVCRLFRFARRYGRNFKAGGLPVAVAAGQGGKVIPFSPPDGEKGAVRIRRKMD